MNQYLFRGKTKDTNEWVYGGVAMMGDRYFIVKVQTYDDDTCSWVAVEVYSESVGQYTGQTDCNNTYIFEGDIVYVESEGENAEIRWDLDTSSFVLSFAYWMCGFDHFGRHGCEVIGNMVDTPHLAWKE